MHIKNKKKHANDVRVNSDSFGQQIISFATKWANKMEAAIRKDDLTKNVAARTARRSGRVNNLQYGYAVIFLSRHWIHGKCLLSLHNPKEITFLT